MVDKARGQWIVCIVDIPSGQNEYVGPFHSEDRAHDVARRLRLNIEAIGATDSVDAVVEWCRPALEIEEIREELIRSYTSHTTPEKPHHFGLPHGFADLT